MRDEWAANDRGSAPFTDERLSEVTESHAEWLARQNHTCTQAEQSRDGGS